MEKATYRQFLDNVGLYVSLSRVPAHWEEYESEYVFCLDDGSNSMHPLHCKSLKELFHRHLIFVDIKERSLVDG